MKKENPEPLAQQGIRGNILTLMGTYQQSVGVFGKDEVGGSNPPSSSRKPPFSYKKGGFSLHFVAF